MTRKRLDRDRILRAACIVAACLSMAFFQTGCGRKNAAVVIPAGGETLDGKTPGTAAGDGGTPHKGSPSGASGGEAAQGGTLAGAEKPKAIYVYVCGAVVSPGVVELPEGSRAADALQAAGGFTAAADTSYVNLAAKVADGEKLYFPDAQEAADFKKQAQEAGSTLVDINTAGVEELCTLPGIGEARAGDIIAYRKANGPFSSVEDIMKVPGIKEGAYAKISEKIIVR